MIDIIAAKRRNKENGTDRVVLKTTPAKTELNTRYGATTLMKIERHFTKEKPNYEYEKRSTKITKPDGEIVFEMENYQAPKHWSQSACDILASKYFRKSGVPQTTQVIHEYGIPDGFQKSESDGGELGAENHAGWVFHRMAGSWTYWGIKEGYFDTDEDAQIFYEEMLYMLYHQMAAPNSPQWFNTGLNWAYGIDSESSGHYYVDSKTGKLMESFSAYERPQPHACFIQSVEDTLVGENSIMNLWEKEARLFKYGSGTGTNFSAIRGEDEPLSGGGQSSGLMSFLKIGDAAAGAIKSGGTTRRAAKMVVVDVDHSEIEKFIDWKMDEEKKAKALILGSEQIDDMDTLDNDWQGEAYRTVSGQNSNNSVRVTDEFMKEATSGIGIESERSPKLLDKIAKAAWACADPGIQFHDTINKWHTCPNDGEIKASNPCSEYMFLDDTACNLASLNLMKFVSDEDGRIIDTVAFEHAVRLWIITLDISVSMAQFPSKAIAQKSYNYRTLGLGYANLGALIMSQGLPYDNDRARGLCAAISALMTGVAYETSCELAVQLGVSEGCASNKEGISDVIKMHYDRAQNLAPCGDETLVNTAKYAWETLIGEVGIYGLRNAQVTVLAPTGTIGLVMDCDTTGIEPDFALVKHKTLAGGGSMEIVNQSVEKGLKSLGYHQIEINPIINCIAGGRDFKHHLCFDKLDEQAPVFHCANEISAEGHLKMMAAAQPFLSGAISKTINMPENATVGDVKQVYIDAWKMDLKAVSIYRDGCKLSQPLTAVTKDDEKEDVVELEELGHRSKESNNSTDAGFLWSAGLSDFKSGVTSNLSTDYLKSVLEKHNDTNKPKRRKLPDRRGGYTQKAKVADQSIYLRTGEYEDGSLGEIFIDMHKEGATFRALMNNFAIAVSIALQHGTPLEKFVEAFTFTKFEPAGLVHGHGRLKTATSFLDYIFRDLGVQYLGREDLAHGVREVKSEEIKTEATAKVLNSIGEPEEILVSKMTGTDSSTYVIDSGKFTSSLANMGRQLNAQKQGYTGDACSACGSFTLRRNGTCMVCDTCGETTGCS